MPEETDIQTAKDKAVSSNAGLDDFMKARNRYSKYSLSRWGEGNTLCDDVCRQLSGMNYCCKECGASTSDRLLRDGKCPDCDGRAAKIMGAEYVSPFV